MHRTMEIERARRAGIENDHEKKEEKVCVCVLEGKNPSDRDSAAFANENAHA